MKIGFDVSQTGSAKAGCGFYADGLIRALAKTLPGGRGSEYSGSEYSGSEFEFILYPAFGDLFWDPECATATFRGPFRATMPPPDFDTSQSFWRNPGPDFEARLGNPDLIHSNNFYCPRGLRRARLVYTLHDLSFLVDPSWNTETNRVGCWQGVFDASTRADWVAANSEYTRRHFLETFPHYPAERMTVIYPASRFRADAPAPPRPDRFAQLAPEGFWLSVGSIEPRKNHRRILEAYRMSGSNLPLVLAGGKGWLMDDFASAAGVMLTGYVSDAELEWLYRNCFAFLYPSLFEGFGMPALEAMTLGAPVIVSNTSSLPEVAGDAGLLVDPGDAAAIAAAMKTLASGAVSREAMRKAGEKQAGRFSWGSSAKKLLAVYEAAGAAPVQF
jgi:glycosyltransferase involved in cell wall biosynthesis